MRTLHHVGAAAPGQATPAESGEAVELGSGDGFGGNRTADSHECGSKLLATAIARAALCGVEVYELPGGSWLLRSAKGADIGVVQGPDALLGAVRGLELTPATTVERTARPVMRPEVEMKGAT